MAAQTKSPIKVLKQLLRLNYNFLREQLSEPPARPGDHVVKALEARFPKREVLHGPFKGMKYASFEAVCSAVFPKLLGSYEQEIQQEILNVIADKPRLILDIGSAEGYYAIGLARLLPDSKVIAADTSETARRLCAAAATLNGCSNVTVTGTIDPAALTKFELKDAFILCDCEGYEKELFTPSVLPALKHTKLIIETHDFIDPSICEYLESLFRETHSITVVSSTDDLLKAKYYHYPELGSLTKKEKLEVVAEYRPSIMEWLILQPITTET